jgi:hypothetical protein
VISVEAVPLEMFPRDTGLRPVRSAFDDDGF